MNCEAIMKCQTLMTRPRGLALLLVLAVMPRAFAQNELNWTPAGGRESTDSTISKRELGVHMVTSNLPLPNTHFPGNMLTNDASLPWTVRLSPWTTDVVKLADAGIDDVVVLAFIDNSGIFSLGADQILRLHESGVPSQFITAMIQHDVEVTSGIRPLTLTAEPSTHHPIQFVLAPVTRATDAESKPPKSSINAAVPAHDGATGNPSTAHGRDSLFEPSDLENNTALPTSLNGSTARNQPIPAPKEKLYRVREPYPEQITAPILVFRAAGITPNTLLIEFPQ